MNPHPNRGAQTIGNHTIDSGPSLPPDYVRWRTWEVGVPIGVPLFVFIWLVIDTAFHMSRFHTDIGDALVATSGAGDFLVLAALIVLNVYGTIELEARETFLDHSKIQGKTATIIVAGALLLSYGIIRVEEYTSEQFSSHEAEYIVAAGSTAALVSVLLWIDKVLCKLHIEKLNAMVRAHYFRSQYV